MRASKKAGLVAIRLKQSKTNGLHVIVATIHCWGKQNHIMASLDNCIGLWRDDHGMSSSNRRFYESHIINRQSIGVGWNKVGWAAEAIGRLWYSRRVAAWGNWPAAKHETPGLGGSHGTGWTTTSRKHTVRLEARRDFFGCRSLTAPRRVGCSGCPVTAFSVPRGNRRHLPTHYCTVLNREAGIQLRPLKERSSGLGDLALFCFNYSFRKKIYLFSSILFSLAAWY